MYLICSNQINEKELSVMMRQQVEGGKSKFVGLYSMQYNKINSGFIKGLKGFKILALKTFVVVFWSQSYV